MFNEVAEKERERKLIDGGLDVSRLVNINLVNREGNAVIRRHLESLPLQSFDSVSSKNIWSLLYKYLYRVVKRNKDEKFLLIENEDSCCM